MVGDSPDTDEQLVRDLLIALSGGDEAQHLHLTLSQAVRIFGGLGRLGAGLFP